MFPKNKLFVLLLLLVFILSACASEKVDLKIVTPPQGYRVSVDYIEGQSAKVPLEIFYQGSEPQKVALITVNGLGPIPCTLNSGVQNNCGTIGLTSTGDQTVSVSVGKNDGSVVTTEAKFSWTPLQGIERVANSVSGLFGTKSLGVGYIFLSILALVIFAIIIAAFVKGISGIAIIIWVSTAIMALTFFVIGTSEALAAFRYLLSFWGTITFIGLVGYAVSKNYTLAIPTTNTITANLGHGRSLTAKIEKGKIVGPDGDDESMELFDRITDASAKVFMKETFPGLTPGKDYQTIYLPEDK